VRVKTEVTDITVYDKMGFFDEIDNSVIVNALEEFSKERDCITFFTSFPQAGTVQ